MSSLIRIARDYDVTVARTSDIDIRYDRRTGRVIIMDHMTGDIMVLSESMFIEAADAIETMKHSAL